MDEPDLTTILAQLTTLLQRTVNKDAESDSSLFDKLLKRMDKFVYDPDQEDGFDLWYLRYEDIFTKECANMDEKIKTRLLLSLLDAISHARFARHIMPKKPNELDWTDTLANLKTLFGSKKSLFRRRFDCLKMNFPPNGDIDSFVNTLKAKSAEADSKNINKDVFECLCFLFAFQAPELSQFRIRFLQKLDEAQNPTVDDLAKDYHVWKSAMDDSKIVESAAGPSIRAVHQQHQKKRRRPQLSGSPPSPCPVCNQNHWKRDCPQFLRTSATQESKAKPSRTRFNRSVIAPIGDVQKYLDIDIDGRLATLQVDTGADITLISRPTWMALGSPHLEPSDDIVKDANGGPIVIHGFFNANFAVTDKRNTVHRGQGKCYVSDDKDLLGMPWIEQLPHFAKVFKEYDIKKISSLDFAALRDKTTAKLKTLFTDVFTPGLGRCTKSKASLFLKPNAHPVFMKKRPVPFASVPLIDKELDRLLEEGVLSPVDHSLWAAPVVIVKKSNGSIRLCTDFSTGLNDSLMLHQHPLPTTEDVFTKLNGGTVFSQVDFADAYLQIEVDDDSKELLTINTHRGLFRYNRLPFGVKSAPGIFQQIIDSMISGLPGVAAYLDDVIVTGRTIQEHNANLEALFHRIQNYGFRVRLDKCNFVMSQLTYLGNVISSTGRRPDPKKIDAILKMPTPKDTAQVRSFLGLLNYYGSFVPEMRQLRAPLDALLKKDASFHWTSDCDAAFNRAKDVLASDLLLTHFNPSLPIIVAADASDYGIGAVISHRFPDGSEKAICHASRSLTSAEKNYGQIEKEGLAIVYAVRKFHRYLYGRTFTLLTDHKPLLSIFGSKKGVPVYTANRLQRWCLTLLAYDFRIEYRNTTSFGQADALSRLIAAHNVPDEDVVIASISKDVNAVYDSALKDLPVTATEVAQATEADDCLRAVSRSILSGRWPRKPSEAVSRYASMRNSLSVQHGCVFFGPRIIIPSPLQPRVLKSLHEGHPGISRMKSLARNHVFWNNINSDIEDIVRSCQPCQEAAKSPTKHTLCSWPKPDGPWNRIHVDFAGPLDGRMYLVIVDAYSKWPEVIEMNSITTAATIRELRRIFAQFGYPETLVSDNGTQFTSADFEEFCKKNGIKHTRSPPFHPQSNGQAERFVDTFKRTLLKLKPQGATQEALQTFLFTYRYTPCNSAPRGLSPAENFIGRPLRTSLSLLKPADTTKSTIRNDDKMETQFNRHHGARPRQFEPDDLVYVRDYRPGTARWIPGRVEHRIGHALYDVSTTSGIIWRRHINQMRPRSTPTAASDLMTAFNLKSRLPDAPQPGRDSPPTSPPRQMPSPTPSPFATAPSSPQPLQPVRRSSRQRREPSRLQIDPHAPSYRRTQS